MSETIWYKVHGIFSKSTNKKYRLKVKNKWTRVEKIGNAKVIDGIRHQSVTFGDTIVNFDGLEHDDCIYNTQYKVQLCDKNWYPMITFSFVTVDPLIQFKHQTYPKDNDNNRSKKSSFKARQQDDNNTNINKQIPSHTRYLVTSKMDQQELKNIENELKKYPNDEKANYYLQTIEIARQTERYNISEYENTLKYAFMVASKGPGGPVFQHKHFDASKSSTSANKNPKNDTNSMDIDSGNITENSNNKIKSENSIDITENKKSENEIADENDQIMSSPIKKDITHSKQFCVGCDNTIQCVCKKDKKSKCECAKRHWWNEIRVNKDDMHLKAAHKCKCVFCGDSFPNEYYLNGHVTAMHAKDKRKTVNTSLICGKTKCKSKWTKPSQGQVTWKRKKDHKCDATCSKGSCPGALYVATKAQWKVAKFRCRRCGGVRKANNETETEILSNSEKSTEEITQEFGGKNAANCPFCAKMVASSADLMSHLNIYHPK